MKVGLRAGGERGAVTVLDVWGSREDSWTRAFKKKSYLKIERLK